MSRPPRPHFAVSTTGEQPGHIDRVDYLPSEHGDLVALQRDLAASELGLPVTHEEGDFARTFMELSALVAHVLGVYQDRYAGEAWLSTATAPSSLVRHARRLAYVPDGGLAATGYVVLSVKPGLRGTIAAGLALASVPQGEVKAQDYETLEDILVDDALDELVPAQATVPVTVAATDSSLVLEGVGHRIQRGADVALVGSPEWLAFTVLDVAEDEAAETTTITLDREVGDELSAADPTVPLRVLANPRKVLRSFGWGADAMLYPPDRLQHAGLEPPAPRQVGGTQVGPLAPPEGTETTFESSGWLADSVFHPPGVAEDDDAPSDAFFWYEVIGSNDASRDVFLSTVIDDRLVGGFVLRRSGASRAAVYRVGLQATATVLFHRRRTETYNSFSARIVAADAGYDVELDPKPIQVIESSHLSGTVTALEVRDEGDARVRRSRHPLPATWLADWATEAVVKARRPNHALVTESGPGTLRLELSGRLAPMAPGRVLLLRNLAGDVAQLVRVIAVVLPPVPAEGEALPEDAVTEIQWEPLTEGPTGGWYLDDLQIFGNVARISHGRSVTKVLGGSDGVTPFLRFTLAQAPVTMLPSARGGEPCIEVRVFGVAWTRVTDFWRSGPDDRHYRVEVDEEQRSTVVFGDGRNGAIPPAGDASIAVTYRVGLGIQGNVEAGRVSRLKQTHPLLERAFNATPIEGGADPARAEDVRAQATRYIRTFDRAVSVQDHADLALLYPGVARAKARWDATRSGVELVVATAEGRAPEAMAELRSYLEARRDSTVPLALRGPSGRAVFLTVSIEADPAYLPEVVKNNVRVALHGEDHRRPGLFSFAARDFGQPVFRSEVYAAVEAAEGVRSCRVTRFAANPEAPVVADVVVIEAHEWLHLAASDLLVNLLPEVR